MLTRKQHELLVFIHQHLKQTGVSPSFDEMKEAVQLKSKSGIHRLITGLEERGFIRRLPTQLVEGFAATLDEWLMAAEYIMSGGNRDVILCERGIRTFSDTTRNTLDLSAIPAIKEVSHLPVIVDPSHAAGHWSLVPAVAKAAVAAGADGLIIEVHPNPKEALVDGLQSLSVSDFTRLMKELATIAASVGRTI